MNDPRSWILILALMSFLVGGSAGFVMGRRDAGAAGIDFPQATGAFVDYEARLSQTLELDEDRRRLFRAVLDHYQADIDAVRERHEARTASAMEPELRELGIRYQNLIRDRVLPENKRPDFDALGEENTRILLEAPAWPAPVD